MTLTCNVYAEPWCRTSALRLVNDSEGNGLDSCYGEVLFYKERVCLFCRGEHFGVVGRITEQKKAREALKEVITIKQVIRNEEGDPIRIIFSV